jgi:hypothetical protein
MSAAWPMPDKKSSVANSNRIATVLAQTEIRINHVANNMKIVCYQYEPENDHEHHTDEADYARLTGK